VGDMNDGSEKRLKYTFIVTGLLVLSLPAIILLSAFSQSDIVFTPHHQILFALVFLVTLAGLAALLYLFNRVSFKAETYKAAASEASQKAMALNAVRDFADTALQNSDFEELLNHLLDKALAVTNAQIGSSFVVDPAARRLRLTGSRGIEDLEKGAFINIDDTLIKHVIDEKKPLLVKDVESDLRIRKKNDPKYGSPSFLSIPVYVGEKGDVTAVLNLSHKKTGAPFNESDKDLLSSMIIEVRLTLENALLQSQVAEYIQRIEDRNARLEQEIAMRRQIESSLRESESRFRNLSDLLPQTVFETDLRGNLLFINKSAFDVFGYSQEDCNKGLNAFQIFVPEDRERLRYNVRRILDGDNLGGVEYTVIKKDGPPCPVVVYANPLRREGTPSGLRGIAIDITERKQAEEIQRKLHDDLVDAEKLAAVGTCAAGIAHEIKNPLAIIIQGVEYLRTCTGFDSLVVEIINKVTKSALRADAIVKGLLSFARQTPLQKNNADIIPFIEESLSFMEHKLNSRHITIVRQYSPDLPTVNIDSTQIKQVFINILSNSIEAMEDGGTITINVENIQKGYDQSYLQISFADTGCGIPEGEIDRVFDPFFTTKDSMGNAGLGLSITKGIMDKHYGTIWVESKVGEGTRVMIGLPTTNLHS
jgi:PAS domain S-box-containing protein